MQHRRLSRHSNATCRVPLSFVKAFRIRDFLIEPSMLSRQLGLMFLLNAEDQHRLIQRFAEILAPGGRLLFTATANPPFRTMR
jgi:hypothetical protein